MNPTSHTDATIMIDARYVCGETSGIGRYTENLIRELLDLDSGLKLRLVTDPREPQAGLDRLGQISERVDFQEYSPEPNSLRTRFAFTKNIDFAGVDLFHSPFNILPANLPVPSVFTLHDIMWLLDVNFCTDSWWRKIITGTFYQQLIPRSVADSQRIMTVSHYSKAAIEDYFPEKSGKVHVTYNGVDPFFSPLPAEVECPLIDGFLPEGAKFVLVVGQGSPYKNHARALAAFIEAFADDPKMYFVLVRRLTRGPAHELHELMNAPRVADRIVQLDHVTGDELRALYTRAHIFLFPSLYEGFGLPGLEAMACGTPVVTSNIGAPDEVGGQAALKVDPKDIRSIAEGLRKLNEDEDLHKLCVERGLAHAATFTWRACAESALSVYKTMLEEI